MENRTIGGYTLTILIGESVWKATIQSGLSEVQKKKGNVNNFPIMSFNHRFGEKGFNEIRNWMKKDLTVEHGNSEDLPKLITAYGENIDLIRQRFPHAEEDTSEGLTITQFFNLWYVLQPQGPGVVYTELGLIPLPPSP